MSYRQWDSDLKELFDQTPGVDYLDTQERAYAEALFEQGFTHTGEEYDAEGLDPDSVRFLRDEFFDFLFYAPDGDWWEQWREAMGYDLWVTVLVLLPSTGTGQPLGFELGNDARITPRLTGPIGVESRKIGNSSDGTAKDTGVSQLTLLDALPYFTTICFSGVALATMYLAVIFLRKPHWTSYCMLSLNILILFTLAFLSSMT